jgi:DNA-binding beta-propeller fold protein YncE
MGLEMTSADPEGWLAGEAVSRRTLLMNLSASLLAVTVFDSVAPVFASQTPADPNVWAAIDAPVRDDLAGLAPRVYVPDEISGDVVVIDPVSHAIVDRFAVGRIPHHITPAYDMSRLFVNVMGSNWLAEVDLVSGRPTRRIPVAAPYNLYFSPVGDLAIVAAESANRLDFYNPITWQPIKRLPIPASGVDHLDFSADGRSLLVSAEFSGDVIQVDLAAMAVQSVLRVGGAPIDVKLAPSGDVYFVANQQRHGVSVIDAETPTEIGFISTGLGAHGLAISRDTTQLYVSNRMAGTVSVIDFAQRDVVGLMRSGGSPDMLQVSPDGSELWASGRNHGRVYVLDIGSGELIDAIRVGSGPHGLTYFPQPGRFCIGHNGVYR